MAKNILDSIEPRTKGLIFDLDGTLVDTMPLHYEAWKETAKKFGFDNYSMEDFLFYAGMPARNIVPLLNKKYSLNIDPSKFRIERAEYFLNYIDRVTVIEPVFSIVQKYSGKLPIAVGTGSSRIVADLVLNRTGIARYINALVTADDVINHKPHPETFLKCADAIDIEPEYCQVFEDANLGIQAAKSAGMMVTDINDYLSLPPQNKGKH